MNVVIIDGMGGGIGKAIIEHIRSELGDVKITAVGTNSIATSAMIKAGANNGATGENAVIYNCAKADYIIGAIGIMFANAMHGEISPQMASAISSSPALKILLPTGKCNVTILGTSDKPIQSYINEIAKKINGGCCPNNPNKS